MKVDPERSVDELATRLGDDAGRVAVSAAWALEQYGRPLDPSAAEQLIRLLTTSVVKCDDANIDLLSQATRRLIPDWNQTISDCLHAKEDLCRDVLAAVQRDGVDR